MENSAKAKKRLIQISPFILAIAAYIIYCFTGSLYHDYDNYFIAIICNGLLGNNNFSQYTHPLLCLILRLFKSFLPSADVFTAFAHFLLIFALGWMLQILLEIFGSVSERIVIIASFLYLCFGIVLWNINYTVWAAFLSFVGILGIVFSEDGNKGIKRQMTGAVLFGFGMMFRWEGSFLLLPYIALIILTGLAEDHFSKESIKRTAKRFMPWLIVIFGLGIGRNVFYSFEPWKTDLAYDNARRIMEDFPTLSWDEMPVIPEGADEYTYRGVTHWMNADTDEVSAEKLSEFVALGKINKYNYDAEGLGKAFIELGIFLFQEKDALLLPFSILFLLCISSKMSKYHSLGIWMALVGTFVIILYFMMRGRLLLRVCQPLLLALFMISIVFKYEAVKDEKHINLPMDIAIGILFLVGCISYGKGVSAGTNVFNAADGRPEEQYASVYAEDKIYLLGGVLESIDLGGMLTQGWNGIVWELMEKGRLPSKAFLRHFLPIGMYWYGQEYYRSMLEEIGVKNPITALFEQDRMRLWDMSDDSAFREYFFVYLYRCYGDMDVIKEKTMNGHQVYRFEKKR